MTSYEVFSLIFQSGMFILTLLGLIFLVINLSPKK